MRKFQLEHYENQLNHQVIHMDQAVCYCPEFRATKMMHDYPSRRLQLARAVYKGEIELSDYIGEINFSSILSRQGERWQNFRECAEDCTDVTILCREMLLKKGYQSPEVKEFQKALEAKEGRLYEKTSWELPMDEKSDKAILLDEETAQNAKAGEGPLREYLNRKGISFVNRADAEFVGFEYFAYGLVEEGIEHLKQLVEKYAKMKVRQVWVLSAQTTYVLTKLADKAEITVPFEVIYLPECLEPMDVKEKTYVYAGSFNLRYLLNAELLGRLIPSESEIQEVNSEEFIPILKGDKRVNALTVWQKPVGAEYKLFCGKKDMLQAIEQDAYEDIERAKAGTIVVFEPTALPKLKEKFRDKRVFHYLELL